MAIDLFCGLTGWGEGLIAEGFEVIGFDIEDMFKVLKAPKPEHFHLVIQDVLSLHGSQFKDAALIVASPPCQEYSYMAMPWSLAKTKAAKIRADETGAELERLNRLFNACFRIQREACEAAGHHIPLVVENVRGAIPWLGRSRWHYGSFHLWGDVPALMPSVRRNQGARLKTNHGEQWNRDRPNFTGTLGWQDGQKNITGGSWFGLNPDGSPGALNNARDGQKVPGFRFDGSGRSFQTASVEGMQSNGAIPHIRDGSPHTKHLTNPAEHVSDGRKHGGDWFSDPSSPSRQGGQLKPPARQSKNPPAEGRKGAGAGAGAEWFDQNTSSLPGNSPRRKAASAMIAKIPFALSSHIGRTYFPRETHTAPPRSTVCETQELT